MSQEQSDRLPVSRRKFIAATVLAASTAGCSSVTQRLFEATPVGLLAEAQDELSLTETTLDAVSSDLEGPANTDIEVTSYTGVYSRAAGLGGR